MQFKYIPIQVRIGTPISIIGTNHPIKNHGSNILYNVVKHKNDQENTMLSA